ncbi:MAG TPA: rhomboid family intramembrane serine protease [Alphaproteobacteria bacterium]|nr:rhomboid family intramembrane serine protease [Alphaproteobacteria bacterium]
MLRVPPATGWLIAINIAVHLARIFLPPEQDDIVVSWLGFDPASLRGPIDWLPVVSLITYQFLHGSWAHLGINMVTLLAFGPGVERPLGAARFLVIYLLSGIAGALLEGALDGGESGDLLIGASAAISGTFGALLVIWGVYRRGRRPMGLAPMALLWIGLMAVTGILGVGAQGTPVAWIAHIGGFLAGMALGGLLRPRSLP